MKNFRAKLLLLLLAFSCAGVVKLSAQSVLITAEGKVDVAPAGSTAWVPATTNAVLKTGDRLRTGLRSRAVVRLANLSVVRVNELTTFVVQPPAAPGKTARLDVQSGATYFFSRERPSDVEFSTPLSSGAIRGTEFNLAVAATDGRSVVTLIDGALTISNSLGGLDIVSGEEATVEPGHAPKKTSVINALNVIQWCLYYPGVIDAGELGLTDAEKQSIASSLDAYQNGDLLAALANYPADRTPASEAEKIYFAQLTLAAGQVDAAVTQLHSLSSPLAGALRELVAAVKNKSYARPVVSNTASEWLADSYFFQSRSKLEEALKAARKSVEHSPNFGFGWARVAELEFSFGHTKAADAALDKALKLAPRNAEAVSLKGFLFAAKGKYTAARKQFDEAIALDGALGNAWLGRGLVRIHSGDAIGGRQDLQVAATVEPQRAILRSYLGKAFANAHDAKHAEKEFALAAKLDANDPTVWLYSALLNEQANRVNDAVRDLEKSQSLNDNRKVYRSQLLLDQDRAVRGANLANIYRDAGMTDTGVREAVQAANSDYANYSSHQFLADSYYNLLDPSGVNLRYETAFQTEYLVANLLAPASAGTLSPQVSQQEYSKLFERDRVGVSSDTTYWSHGDWRQRAVEFGNFGGTAFAFEQDYTSTHGYRPNSGLEDTVYDFKLKQELTRKDSAFVEVELRETHGGNTAQYYDQASAANAPFTFSDRQQPLVVAGLHHEWSSGSDTLLLVSRLVDAYSVTNPFATGYVTGKEFVGGPSVVFYPFFAAQNYRSDLEIYSAEAQHIWQTHRFTTIVGARWQTGEFDTKNSEDNASFNLSDILPTELARQDTSAKFNRENIYAYEQWQALDSLRLIAGVSYDRLVMPENIRYAPVSGNAVTKYHLLPKAGLIWNPLVDTTVRAGYSQSVGGASFDQSFQLEPSQVAGFNQAFRSLIPESVAGANAGALFTVYGISLEQKLPTGTYLAVEGALLKSKLSRQDGVYEFNDTGGPFLSSVNEDLDYTEWSVTGSAHQLIGRDWSLGLVYRLSHARLQNDFPDISQSAADTGALVTGPNGFAPHADYRGLMHTLDLQAVWQHPTGLFGRADAVWTHQDNEGDSAVLPGEDFWQINLQAGKRFFHRHAELTAGILNVTGQNYRLNPLNLRSETPHDRVFFTQFKFQF